MISSLLYCYLNELELSEKFNTKLVWLAFLLWYHEDDMVVISFVVWAGIVNEVEKHL